LELVFTTGALVASQTLEFTGVQVEQNSQPTPFEQRPISTELGLCQRYFCKSYNQSSAPGAFIVNGFVEGAVSTDDTSLIMGAVRFPVEMRAAPTVTPYAPQTGTINSATRYISAADAACTVIGIGSGGFRAVYLNSAGTATNLYRTHYTASSEL
jgi:hypothetical protein